MGQVSAVFCWCRADNALEGADEVRVVEESRFGGYVAYAVACRAKQCLRGVYADFRYVVRRRHLHESHEEPPELRGRELFGDRPRESPVKRPFEH